MQFEKHANYMSNPTIEKNHSPLVLHVGFNNKISASFPMPNLSKAFTAIEHLPKETYFLLEQKGY